MLIVRKHSSSLCACYCEYRGVVDYYKGILKAIKMTFFVHRMSISNQACSKVFVCLIDHFDRSDNLERKRSHSKNNALLSLFQATTHRKPVYLSKNFFQKNHLN